MGPGLEWAFEPGRLPKGAQSLPESDCRPGSRGRCEKKKAGVRPKEEDLNWRPAFDLTCFLKLPVQPEQFQSRFNPGHHPARNFGLPISILNQIRLNLVCPNRSRMSK